MRSLDSNVLIRYLIADDPFQTTIAERIIEECEQRNEPVFITVLVLCETMWVLDRVYRLSRAQIIDTVSLLLSNDAFRFEHDSLVRQAFHRFSQSKADFPDYLIGAISAGAGCRDTVTFDKALSGAPGFTLL